jgi:pyrroline-5-carboxylate reductase
MTRKKKKRKKKKKTKIRCIALFLVLNKKPAESLCGLLLFLILIYTSWLFSHIINIISAITDKSTITLKINNMKETTTHNRNFGKRIAILGGGNIGQALASGFIRANGIKPSQIYITRRQLEPLAEFNKRGFKVTSDNIEAVNNCKTVIIAVQPGHLIGLLDLIRPAILPNRHLLLSTVTGVSVGEITTHLGCNVPVVRVMPNTAVAIGESMTCLAANGRHGPAFKAAVRLFNKVGNTLVIDEENMTAATSLCACGIAFFLRSIRAASQGGIQIGFSADEARQMAAQTARGAASLLLKSTLHPESEIDKVTTPRGCTIAGLNRMEHEGFSSAMIKGLVTATDIAASLFKKEE